MFYVTANTKPFTQDYYISETLKGQQLINSVQRFTLVEDEIGRNLAKPL